MHNKKFKVFLRTLCAFSILVVVFHQRQSNKSAK